MRERSKYNAMYVWKSCLYVVCYRECVVVGIARHTYHKVNVHCAQYLISLLRSTNLCKSRWIAQTQFHILVVYLLFHTSVVLKHKGVVGISHDKHVIDASHHQVDEGHILEIKFLVFLWYHRFSLLGLYIMFNWLYLSKRMLSATAEEIGHQRSAFLLQHALRNCTFRV